MSTTEVPTVEQRQRTAQPNWLRRLSGRAKAPLHALARIAARSYIAGDQLDDAIHVAHRFEKQGVSATIGYWDGPDDSASGVMQAYRLAVDGILASGIDAYLSIKFPSLKYSQDRLAELAMMARERHIGLHFDALGPETVDRTWAAIEGLAQRTHLGCTIPGRWRRSLADADWAIEHHLGVRVVKGQWPDPDDPRLDPNRGFIEVVRRLAGRARHVAVATHDLAIARRAIDLLLASRTPTTLELLYGLPSRKQMELGRELGVSVRIYVPYGAAYLPYCLSQMKRNPRIAWWLVRDALRRA
jgi:proline dehydrogenase